MATGPFRLDKSLIRAAYSFAAGNRSSALLPNDGEDGKKSGTSYLVNLGSFVLPYHPLRMRYLPYTNERIVLYGQKGYQSFSLARSATEVYTLQKFSWEIQMCDCVQTSDLYLYVVTRSHDSAVISCYDDLMNRQMHVEIGYPLGCLSSLATDHDCKYLYGTNPELNCLLRFTPDDLTLQKSQKFGCALWRPLDCCVSQLFTAPDGTTSQYLFVSNVDSGTFVFDLLTMNIVAVADDDLDPGAKYLTYDPRRSLLFVSCSNDRLLRCHKFNPWGPKGRPCLEKTGDFQVAGRKSVVRSTGSQCVMWDPTEDHLAVTSWSRTRFQFVSKVFRVYLSTGGEQVNTVNTAASTPTLDSGSLNSLQSILE